MALWVLASGFGDVGGLGYCFRFWPVDPGSVVLGGGAWRAGFWGRYVAIFFYRNVFCCNRVVVCTAFRVCACALSRWPVEGVCSLIPGSGLCFTQRPEQLTAGS